jgi:hypothetical protein
VVKSNIVSVGHSWIALVLVRDWLLVGVVSTWYHIIILVSDGIRPVSCAACFRARVDMTLGLFVLI